MAAPLVLTGCNDDSKDKQIRQAEAEADAARSRIAELETALSDDKVANERQNQQAKAEADAARSRIAELETALSDEKVATERAWTTTVVRTYPSELAALGATLIFLSGAVAIVLRGPLELLRLKRSRRRWRWLRAEEAGLRSRLDALKAEEGAIRRTEDRVKAMEAILDRKRDQIQQMTATLAEQEADRNARDAAAGHLRAEVQQMQGHNAALVGSERQARTEAAERLQKAERLEREAAAMRAEMLELRGRDVELTESERRTKAEAVNWARKVRRLEGEIKTLRAAADARTDDEANIFGLKAQILTLSRTIAELQARAEQPQAPGATETRRDNRLRELKVKIAQTFQANTKDSWLAKRFTPEQLEDIRKAINSHIDEVERAERSKSKR